MAAPKGNQFWKQRSKHGRDKLFTDASLLWESACEYFEWCDKNPWISEKTKFKPISGEEIEKTPTARPYSMSGLCIYLGCGQGYFYEFKKNCSKDLSDIITRIEEVIETQQFEGATVGAFNANIIARKLGLADKKELTGKDGEHLFSDKPLTKEELQDRIRQISDNL